MGDIHAICRSVAENNGAGLQLHPNASNVTTLGIHKVSSRDD